jgi:hypothetical protein
MTAAQPLFLYEEVLLLALRNRTGTTTAYPEHAIAGAILAELLLSRRITVEAAQAAVMVAAIMPMIVAASIR